MDLLREGEGEMVFLRTYMTYMTYLSQHPKDQIVHQSVILFWGHFSNKERTFFRYLSLFHFHCHGIKFYHLFSKLVSVSSILNIVELWIIDIIITGVAPD